MSEIAYEEVPFPLIDEMRRKYISRSGVMFTRIIDYKCPICKKSKYPIIIFVWYRSISVLKNVKHWYLNNISWRFHINRDDG